MKSFLKSKKGILGLIVLTVAIIVLAFVVVKCNDGSDEKKKDVDKIKIEEEQETNDKENGRDTSDVVLEPEDTSNAGLQHKGGDVGKSNKEDVTEFPNDIDGDETSGTDVDNSTDMGNTDTQEPKEDFKGGTLY